MNSLEVLRDSKKSIETIHEALLGALLGFAKGKSIEIGKLEPAVETRGAAFEFTNFGLLRFNTSKGIATYSIGFSDPKDLQIWRELLPPRAADPNGNTKSFEFELTKSFFIALDPLLKAQGFVADPKSIVFQEGAVLGGWGKINVEQTIKFPFTTPLGQLTFEIPVFNAEYVANLTFSLYGLKSTARVLVVDDSLVSRQHSRSCLAMAGYFNIDEAADGQAALTRVLGSSPPIELVVADWHMPIMSGFELLKKIRAVPELKKLPVILVTGEKNKEEIINAIREGVTSYLVKPVAPENFFSSLKKAGGRA